MQHNAYLQSDNIYPMSPVVLCCDDNNPPHHLSSPSPGPIVWEVRRDCDAATKQTNGLVRQSVSRQTKHISTDLLLHFQHITFD